MCQGIIYCPTCRGGGGVSDCKTCEGTGSISFNCSLVTIDDGKYLTVQGTINRPSILMHKQEQEVAVKSSVAAQEESLEPVSMNAPMGCITPSKEDVVGRVVCDCRYNQYYVIVTCKKEGRCYVLQLRPYKNTTCFTVDLVEDSLIEAVVTERDVSLFRTVEGIAPYKLVCRTLTTDADNELVHNELTFERDIKGGD